MDAIPSVIGYEKEQAIGACTSYNGRVKHQDDLQIPGGLRLNGVGEDDPHGLGKGSVSARCPTHPSAGSFERPKKVSRNNCSQQAAGTPDGEADWNASGAQSSRSL